MGNHMEQAVWIDFRYEGIPGFCFNCGKIGHYEDMCPLPNKSKDDPSFVNPLGPWLRSNHYGRRLVDPSERRFSSNPMKSPSYGNYSPIPKEMIRKMSELALASKRKGSEKSTKPQQHNNPSIPTDLRKRRSEEQENGSVCSTLDVAGSRKGAGQNQ